MSPATYAEAEAQYDAIRAWLVDQGPSIIRRIQAPMEDFASAIRRVNEAIARDTAPALRAFARFARRADQLRAEAALTRPDGRPRRSGHRHRGTREWDRRHG